MASSSSSPPPPGAKPPHQIVTTRLAKRLTITIDIDGTSHLLSQTTPVRYYFPKRAVQPPFRLDLHDGKETYCPFKGFASYYHAHFVPDQGSARAQRIDDLFWTYSEPFSGSHAEAIAGYLCVDAPSQRCQLKVDGRSVSLQVAKELNDKILKASPTAGTPSPSQPRPSDDQRRLLQTPRRAPMHRTVSSEQPEIPANTYGFHSAMDLQLDSADPLLADLVYRLDDQHRSVADDVNQATQRGGSGEQSAAGVAGGAGEGNEPGDITMDPHLAWFRDRPWYRRPSDKWMRPLAFLLALAAGMCMGPKLELLNALVCEQVLGKAAVGNTIIGGDIDARGSTSDRHSPVHAAVRMAAYQSWPELDSPSDALFAVPTLSSPAASLSVNHTTVDEPDRPTKSCLSNPEVQSSLAALQLRLTLSMGILAALTTGFWSNLSSRIGRLSVLRFAILGFICTDLATITVGLVPRSQLPGGVNFLLIGTTIEGLFGGYGTAIAVHQLYISDATPSGTRAHIFAHFMGIFSAGIAIGPTLGGLLVKRTGKILSPFYFALGTHLLYAFCAVFIMPESTSPAAQQKAIEEHKASRLAMRLKAEERRAAKGAAHASNGNEGETQPLLGGEEGAAAQPVKPWKKRVWKRIKVAFVDSVLHAPLEPLALLLPKKVRVPAEEEEQQRAGVPLRSALAHPEASASHISVSHVAHKMRYDTNLFFLSLTYFVECSIIGIMSYKMQYAQQQFLWDSSQLGLFLSFAGLARVLALGLVLPVVIKILHRPVKALTLPHDGVVPHDEPGADPSLRRRSVLDADGRIVLPDSSSDDTYGTFASGAHASNDDEAAEHGERGGPAWDATQKSVEELWTLRAKHLRLIHDSKFDLKLSKISIAVNTLAYALLIFSKTPFLFFLGSGLAALGGGAGAAMSSLALALLESPSDAGKLFGAWSIISAIASTIVGPLLFAKIYEATTRVFVGAIFVVATAMFVVALAILSLVKVRKPVSLPSLPARPPPPPSSSRKQDESNASAAARGSGTWKSAFSMRTRRKDGGDAARPSAAGRDKRPELPFRRD
ncbi:uncharacterized protein PSFLO_06432 [Pseudozyma flocculosa]|uniref:DUF427 domain-containing protein n=1 Tax=Pseudozyma flocculosa TaxID=84751 RepID=A0A5C3F9R2_9BASI|nr:uncharacterized protein PSFLO_06432 [Pseudozyma flocculosa]